MKKFLMAFWILGAFSDFAAANSIPGSCKGLTSTGEVLSMYITTVPDAVPVILTYRGQKMDLDPVDVTPPLPDLFMTADRRYIFEMQDFCGKGRLTLPDGSTAILSCRIEGICGHQ